MSIDQSELETLRAEIEDLRAQLEALRAEKHAWLDEQRAGDKLTRRRERAMRQLETNARKQGEVSERNRAMMVHANEVLAAEVQTRREVEAQLRLAMTQAQDATRAKSEFLAHMSHELRTPMNGVLGMLELAMEATLAPDVKDLLRTADGSARELLVLLNDILDFSKVEARALELEAVPFSPWDAVDDVFAVLSPCAIERGLELRLRGVETLPAELVGDPIRYRQVLKNLLSNAIKFTPTGSVTVHLAYRDNQLFTTVEDTGVGIPLDRREAIFRPFTQADTSTSRRFGGTGLGLTIVHRLVDLMGGALALESTVGEGSRFSFSAEFAVHRRAWPGIREVSSRQVCIIDAPATDQLLVPVLLSFGCQVRECGGGDCACAARCDIVFTSEREPPKPCRGLEVLVLDPGDGVVVDHRPILRRPIRRKAVLGVLERAFRHERETPLRNRECNEELRVLIVEDNVVNRSLARKMLQRLGYRPEAVEDGRQAIEAVSTRPYDIVFMDCQMPVLDGYAATQCIRARRDGHQPVVVALTANALEGNRQRCEAAGMDDYLTKPLGLRELERCLHRWTGRGASADMDPSPTQAKTVP